MYTDLFRIPEDERIDIIGNHVTKHRQTVGFMVEKIRGDKSKGDRYIEKLKKKFPQISVMARFDGPGEDVETIKVGVVM